MSVTEELRKAFDDCTVMAGVDPDFECVYITKDAALMYLDEIDAVNDALRELVRDLAHYRFGDCQHCGYAEQYKTRQTNCYKVSVDLHRRARELGIEVDR